MKKLSNKSRGVAAIALAGIIVTGGSSFALWSDSAAANGGTITSGNLDVEASETGTWRDISDDRTDKGHEINLDTFKIVPGDTIEGTYDVKAALEGDNLVANLGFVKNASGLTLAPANLASNLKVSAKFVDSTGKTVATSNDLTKPTSIQFASADNSNKGDLPTLPAELPEKANYKVVLNVTFDKETSDQELVKTQSTLDGMTVTLEQTRTEAHGYKN